MGAQLEAETEQHRIDEEIEAISAKLHEDVRVAHERVEADRHELQRLDEESIKLMQAAEDKEQEMEAEYKTRNTIEELCEYFKAEANEEGERTGEEMEADPSEIMGHLSSIAASSRRLTVMVSMTGTPSAFPVDGKSCRDEMNTLCASMLENVQEIKVCREEETRRQAEFAAQE